MNTVRVLVQPRLLLVHLGAVLAVLAMVLMGRWQYAVWHDHRVDRAAALIDAPAQPLADLLGPDDAFPRDAVGLPVTTSGRWLPDETVYIADRAYDGRSGYWAVTPLQIGASSIPVVLGWTPTPSATPPTGLIDLTGWLQPVEQDSTPDTDPADGVLPALTSVAFVDRLSTDVYSGYLMLRAPADARQGMVAVTPESLPKPPASTSLRNLLYAGQWWLFAGFAVYVWGRFCRDVASAA